MFCLVEEKKEKEVKGTTSNDTASKKGEESENRKNNFLSLNYTAMVQTVGEVSINERAYRLDYIVNTLIPTQMTESDDIVDRNVSTLNLKIPLNLDNVITV